MAAEDVASALRDALAEAPTLHAWAAAHAERSLDAGRGTIHVARLGAFPTAVRHARRGGWMALLLGDRYFGRPPRPFRELAVSERLRAAGVGTPRVLAALVFPATPGYRGDLAVEWLEPGHDLRTLLAPNLYPLDLRRIGLAASGREIGRAHAVGLNHPDLNVGNVFLGPSSDGGWNASLLDLDKATIGPRSRTVARRNLERFTRSLAKEKRLGRIAWDPEDLQVFLEAHAAEMARIGGHA